LDIELIAHLKAPQQEVFLQWGSPLLIIAGPGMGKTEVIAYRVAYLVSSGLVNPEDILAVTYTENAANNIKDCIQQKLPDVNVKLMHISTIHWFCAVMHLTPTYHMASASWTVRHNSCSCIPTGKSWV
jgi:DNA helicase II / ATP-dependent DNA helicase PcrA